MLLPGILTYEGIPHALRVIGVIPVVYIFVALGGWWVYEKTKKVIKNQKLLIAVCVLFILAQGGSEFNKYFFTWARNPNVKGAFTERYADIGNYLNSLPDEYKKYVIVNEPGAPLYGISIPAQSLMFIESTKFGQPRSQYLKFEDLDQIKIGGEKTIIIPLYDGKVFEELKKKFSEGNIVFVNGFDTYELK